MHFMETIKQKQIGELVKRHFSLALQEEGGYIYGTAPLVTVTAVKMSPDLSLAKIYLSVYNTENKQAVILEMEEEKSRLRQLLAARLRRQVRRVPEIDFYLDDTLDEMARLQQLFTRLHEENAMGSDSEE
jgi:ribosome-binding factor A